MGNNQLFPAYNIQAGICDEYITITDAKPYASDMECCVPLMERFKETYGHYWKYHNNPYQAVNFRTDDTGKLDLSQQ